MSRLITVLLIATATLAGCKKKVVDPVDVEQPLPAPVVPKADSAPAPAHVQKLIENFNRVFFETDTSTLGAEAKDALKANADIMREHDDVIVEVQGHADERGTIDHNLALGQRRADAVRSFMTLQGVDGSRIKTVSYGEERPLSSGSGEHSWSQNRRAEFRVTWSENGKVQGSTSN